MDFRTDEIFFLMAVPLLLVGVYALHWRWKHQVVRRVGDAPLVAQMIESRSGRREVASFVMVALGLVLLVTALAGPQWGEKQREVKRRGIDIVFAVDISRSMQAEDVPPSRLGAARAEITRILRLLDGDRVGLVAFAGIAFAQCPLTSDYAAVRTFLDLLDPDHMPVQGTAVGRAVREGVRLLTGRRSGQGQDAEGGTGRDMRRGHDQIIVLFTDGEDHETLPEEAAAEARAEGIRVFTVPIGTEAGAEIPVYGPDGRRTGSLTDMRGQIVVSRMNPDALDAIAAAGGGMSVPYRGEGSVAEVLAPEVDRMMAEELEDILRPEREDRFYFFLAPALLLVFLGTALSDRRRNGSATAWMAGLLMAALLPMGLLLGACGDAFVYDSDQVREGLTLSREGSGEAAIEEIRGFRSEIAPEDLLDEPALDYNEGVVLLRDGQLEEAGRQFLSALGSRDPEVQFRSYYNLGNIAFEQEQWEQALDRYRQALELRPDDEDAKWNLEVTLRRLFPPCSYLEDAFEENDRPEEARPLELPQDTDMPPQQEPPEVERVLCGGDSDWYRLEQVPEGARVSVDVTFERLREDTGGAELPDELPADAVRIALYEGDGNTVLGTDAGEHDRAQGWETIDARQVERHLRHVPVPAGSAPSGTLFLEIDANLGLEYRYDVQVTVIPPCSSAEDGLEENDNREHAAPVEPGEFPLMMCAGDDDWFRFSVELGDTVFVDIQPGPDQTPPDGTEADAEAGDHTVALRAELYRAGESEPLDASWGRDGLLELAVQDIETPGDFELRVAAMLDTGQGQYVLSFYRFPPCIVGDDHHEENDQVSQAAPLDPTQGPQRHLRICEGDDDWFQAQLTEGEHFSVAVSFAEADRELDVAMTAPGEERVLAWGTPVEVEVPAQRVEDELSPPPPRDRFRRQIHVEEPEQTGACNLRVSGDPGFYNIEFPDPNSDQSCDNPQQDESDQQEESDQQDESDDQSEDEQDQSDQQDQDEERGDDQRPEANEDRAQGDEQDQSEPQAGDEQASPEMTPDMSSELGEMSEEDRAEQRLRRLLESLSAEQDLNLQLEQALDQLAPIRTENPW